MEQKIEWIEQYLMDAERMIVEGGPQLDQGMNVLNDLLYAEPGYGSLHNHLGWAHLYYTLNYAMAEAHLKAAIRFQPDFHAPYQHLGTLYYRQARYKESIDICILGLEQPFSNKVVMYEMIGQSYEMMKEFKLAIRAYKDAMLSTLVSGEMNVYSESIKRCRKKRWTTFIKY